MTISIGRFRAAQWAFDEDRVEALHGNEMSNFAWHSTNGELLAFVLLASEAGETMARLRFRWSQFSGEIFELIGQE